MQRALPLCANFRVPLIEKRRVCVIMHDTVLKNRALTPVWRDAREQYACTCSMDCTCILLFTPVVLFTNIRKQTCNHCNAFFAKHFSWASVNPGERLLLCQSTRHEIVTSRCQSSSDSPEPRTCDHSRVVGYSSYSMFRGSGARARDCTV